MDHDSNPYFLPAGRRLEIAVGLFVLAVAALLGFFGIRGAVAYFHGSRAAPADPIACAIGLLALVVFGFLGLRLVTGWADERPLLPNLFLFLAALGCLAGSVWFAIISRQLHEPLGEQLRMLEVFGVAGVTGLLLWWRRLHRA